MLHSVRVIIMTLTLMIKYLNFASYERIMRGIRGWKIHVVQCQEIHIVVNDCIRFFNIVFLTDNAQYVTGDFLCTFWLVALQCIRI